MVLGSMEANTRHGKEAGKPAAQDNTQHSPAARPRKATRHRRTQHSTARHHDTPHHATGQHQHTTGRQARQRRTQRHTTARGTNNSTDHTGTEQQEAQRNTAPQTQEEDKNQHHHQSKTDSRAPQSGTTQQHSTTEHGTQHRGAGRHNKPQHTAGQQAMRPGGRTRDKAHQQKTTAGNQTQQGTPSKHRQQHTTPARANEATEHRQHETMETAAHHTTGSNTEQHSTAPRDSKQQRATTGDQARAKGGSSRGGGRTGKPHETQRAQRPGDTAHQDNTQHNTPHNNARRHGTKTARHNRAPHDTNKRGGHNAHGRPPVTRPTTQHNNTAHSTTPAPSGTEKHRKTPRTMQTSPQQTASPDTKTRGTAKQQEEPRRGGGAAHSARTKPEKEKKANKERERRQRGGQPQSAKAQGTQSRKQRMGVGRPGSDALPFPNACAWGVRPGSATHWLWVRGMWAWGPVTETTARALASWRCVLWGQHEVARGERSLPWVWGVRGRALSPARPPVLGACGRGPPPTGCGCGGCERGDPSPTLERALFGPGVAHHWGGLEGARGGRLLTRCRASGVWRSPTPNCPSLGRAAGAATHWLWVPG